MTRITYTQQNDIGNACFFDIHWSPPTIEGTPESLPPISHTDRAAGSLEGVRAILNQIRMPVPDDLTFPPLREQIIATYDRSSTYFGRIEDNCLVEVNGHRYRNVFTAIPGVRPALAGLWREGNQHSAYLTPPPALSRDQEELLLERFFGYTEQPQVVS